MNITEDILRLSESETWSGDSGPAAGPLGEILVESLSRADGGRASWCTCISSVLDLRAGA
ncbi:hypothetical protein ACIGO8_24905 [Streptomyces sp. NPDC053493]|uniref:hypothetical protein n=1 Tax=Streptomyces sp. NPDC053493 TaxID=3365705 RepID=UPI0037CF6386